MSNVALTRTNLLLETAKVRRLRKTLGSPSDSEAVRRAINERLEVEAAGTKGGLMAKTTLAKSRGPKAGRREGRLESLRQSNEQNQPVWRTSSARAPICGRVIKNSNSSSRISTPVGKKIASLPNREHSAA
jgi:hypothetical protein